MRRAVLWTGIAVAALDVAAGCSSSSDGAGGCVRHHRSPGPPCPTEPCTSWCTVDQWGDIVRQLGGDCADVTTIIKGSDVDPHDYEPTPADIAGSSTRTSS